MLKSIDCRLYPLRHFHIVGNILWWYYANIKLWHDSDSIICFYSTKEIKMKKENSIRQKKAKSEEMFHLHQSTFLCWMCHCNGISVYKLIFFCYVLLIIITDVMLTRSNESTCRKTFTDSTINELFLFSKCEMPSILQQ